MKTNLEWFRSFKAIYETGTLTEAAKQLSLSQPGVSLHLSSLEAYTRFPLFDRRSKKMFPTEKGKMLYHQVENLLTSFDDIEELLHKKSGNLRPNLSLGMCSEMFQFFLDDEVPKLDFNLIAKFEHDESLHQLLQKGILDLIITHRNPQEKGMQYEQFFTEKLVLVAGKLADHHTIRNLIQQQDWIAIKSWLIDQKWYGTAADMEHIHHFWKVHFQEMPNFSPNYIVPNKFSIIRSMSQDNSFSVLPEIYCQNNPNLEIIETGKDVLNPLYFCQRINTTNSDVIETIKNRMKNKLQQIL